MEVFGLPLCLKEPIATDQSRKCQEEVYEVPSSPSLSSNAVSDEFCSATTVSAKWPCSPPPPVSTPLPPTPPPTIPPSPATIITLIQKEIQVIKSIYLAGTPTACLSHALVYILNANYGWQTKCCCQAKDRAVPSTIPIAWLDDIVVVTPSEGVHFVVDLSFRQKFSMRCTSRAPEASLDECVAPLPHEYIGLAAQLYQDVTGCAKALEVALQSQLPPWRNSHNLRRFYKFCVEYDATPSSCCLCVMRSWVMSGTVPSKKEESFCSYIASMDYIDRLMAALSLSESFARHLGIPHVKCAPNDDSDFQFEKVEPIAQPLPQCSGLSYLLQQSRKV